MADWFDADLTAPDTGLESMNLDDWPGGNVVNSQDNVGNLGPSAATPLSFVRALNQIAANELADQAARADFARVLALQNPVTPDLLAQFAAGTNTQSEAADGSPDALKLNAAGATNARAGGGGVVAPTPAPDSAAAPATGSAVATLGPVASPGEFVPDGHRGSIFYQGVTDTGGYGGVVLEEGGARVTGATGTVGGYPAVQGSDGLIYLETGSGDPSVQRVEIVEHGGGKAQDGDPVPEQEPMPAPAEQGPTPVVPASDGLTVPPGTDSQPALEQEPLAPQSNQTSAQQPDQEPKQEAEQEPASPGGVASSVSSATIQTQVAMPGVPFSAPSGAAHGSTPLTKAIAARGRQTGHDAVNANWKVAKPVLIAAAKGAGVNPGTMVKIAGLESNFDPTARPVVRPPKPGKPDRTYLNKVRQFDGTMAISSAHGYGQLTDAAWTDAINHYGKKYGIPDAGKLTTAQAAKYRTNAGLQAKMLAELARRNIASGRRFGGTNDEANAYALHNLGPGDGPEFLSALKARPNDPVKSVLDNDEIAGNPSLYGNGSISLREAYNNMINQLNAYQKFATEADQL